MKIRDRIKELRRVRAGDLTPNPRNWRTHPQAQVDALRGIIAEIGYADALLARELPCGTLELIDGHARQELDPDQIVPVLVLDLDQDEALKLMTVLDPLAAMAEANESALESLLAEIQTDNEGVQAMLDEMAAEHGMGGEEIPAADAEPQIDRAAELQKEWGTEAGQVWEIPGQAGVHRVMCGDSTSKEDVGRLMGEAKADMVLSDPPYGVAYVGKTKDALEIEGDDLNEGDLAKLIAAAFDLAEANCRPGAYWYATVSPGPLHLLFAADWNRRGILRQIMVWAKDSMVLGHSEYHYQHEPILFGWVPGNRHKNSDRTRTTLWQHDRPKASREHPTMKPISLWATAVRDGSRPDETIFDPFLGSGTTLIAAEQLSRICYGMEISPAYVAVILQRAKDCGLEPRIEGVT